MHRACGAARGRFLTGAASWALAATLGCGGTELNPPPPKTFAGAGGGGETSVGAGGLSGAAGGAATGGVAEVAPGMGLPPGVGPFAMDATAYLNDGFGGEDPPCWLSMPVSGAMQTTLQATGCGYSSIGGGWTLRWTLSEYNSSKRILVALEFYESLDADELGSFTLHGLSITDDPNIDVDGDESVWRAPDDACGIQVWINQAVSDDSLANRHDVRLTGACAMPLSSQAVPAAAPITVVGQFNATAFVE